MTNQEYAKTQIAICRLAEIVCQLDLVAFIDQNRLADAVGPIMDPTLYRQGFVRLEEINKLANAFLQVQAHRQKMKLTAGEEVNTLNESTAKALLPIFQS